MRIIKKYLHSGLFDLIPTNVFPKNETQEVGYTLDSLGLPVPTYMLPLSTVYNHLYSTPSSTMRTDNIGILLGEYHTLPSYDDGTKRSSLVLWAYDNIPISAEDIAYSIPYFGDALDAGVSLLHLDLGNYGQAGIGLGLLLAPNILEKPLKSTWRVAKLFFEKAHPLKFNIAKNGRTNVIFDGDAMLWRIVPDGTGMPSEEFLSFYPNQESFDKAVNTIFDPSLKTYKDGVVLAPKDSEPLPPYDILDLYKVLEERGGSSDISVGGRLAYDYYTSPERLKRVKEAMGWDDAAVAEYLLELKQNFLYPFFITREDLPPGIRGKHRLRQWSDGNFAHYTSYNKNHYIDALTALELGMHEIGAHGGTANLRPDRTVTAESTEAAARQAFPRTFELMLKNSQLANEILKPNDIGETLKLFGTKEEFLNSDLYAKLPEMYKNYFATLYDQLKGLNDLELYARGFVGKLFDRHFPEAEPENIMDLELFYTPESIDAYKKALLGLAPWLFGGTVGYNYLNSSKDLSKNLL